MFERYTGPARRTVFMARREAAAAGSPYIETHHLLLGLPRERQSFAAQILRSYGVDAARLREDLRGG